MLIFYKKDADISKIKGAKFHVSSTILTSFRQGGTFSPAPKNEPLKSPPRLGLSLIWIIVLG